MLVDTDTAYIGKIWLKPTMSLQKLIETLQVPPRLLEITENDYVSIFQDHVLQIHISWGSVEDICAVKFYIHRNAERAFLTHLEEVGLLQKDSK